MSDTMPPRASDKPAPFSNDPILWENRWAFAVESYNPVSRRHVLVIPKNFPALGWLDMAAVAYDACWELARKVARELRAEYPTPDGFNIGINIGSAAGQTVQRPHIHIIARYVGDNPNPRGGIRAVIPGKADPSS